jgi:hypothetical protein
MHLCAFLAPDAIDVRELAKAKEHLPPRLAEILWTQAFARGCSIGPVRTCGPVPSTMR